MSLIAVSCFAAITVSQTSAQFTTVIDLDDPSDVGPTNIDSDTQVNVSGDGVLFGEFITHNVGLADGSSENIEVNIAGGVLGGGLVNFFAGSVTNFSGGLYEVFSGVFNDGATLRVSGGRVSPFGITPTFLAGSTLEIVGGEFFSGSERIVGLNAPGDEVILDAEQAGSLGAILADGRRFALSPDFDPLSTVRLRAAPLPPQVGGTEIRASADPIPPYLREGQTFTLDIDAELPEDFLAGPGSRVIVDAQNTATPTAPSIIIPGTNAPDVFAIAAEVVVTGGPESGSGLWVSADNGSRVRLENGSLSSFSTVSGGSELIVTGGRVDTVSLSGSSLATISGGTLGGAQNIGDERRGGVRLFDDSELHLIGTEFLLDGEPINGLLTSGDSLVLPELQGRLTGTLLDGETFIFLLGQGFSGENRSSFSPESTVRLTLVPEPASLGFLLVMGVSLASCKKRR